MRNEEHTAAALRPPRTAWLWLLGLPLLLWVLLHPRGVAVEVATMTWRREIDIERQVVEMHSERCERLPAEAHLLERRTTAEGEWCRFLAPSWRKARMALNEGRSPEAPRWPVVALAPGERGGAQRAVQELLLRDAANRSWSCRLDLQSWRHWQPGMRTRLAVHRFSGVANCASLTAAPMR